MVFLDLAKAFDSVNHELLARGLRRQGCPDHFIEVVKDLYTGAVTQVSNGVSYTRDIDILSGVKQGCPLSPLLFNLVMDELVDRLSPSLGYQLSEKSAISTLAFADDLVLVSESLPGIEALLKETETFMRSRGLSINPRKSHTIGLKKVGARKQLRILTEPFLTVAGSELPVLSANNSARYLGLEFGPGGAAKVVKAGFREMFARLVGSGLKPRQKIECLRKFVLPRWNFRLAVGRVTITLLHWLHREVRRAVRQIVHARDNLFKEFIHLKVRDGGLGIPSVVESTYIAKSRIRARLLATEDEKVCEVVNREL